MSTMVLLKTPAPWHLQSPVDQSDSVLQGRLLRSLILIPRKNQPNYTYTTTNRYLPNVLNYVYHNYSRGLVSHYMHRIEWFSYQQQVYYQTRSMIWSKPHIPSIKTSNIQCIKISYNHYSHHGNHTFVLLAVSSRINLKFNFCVILSTKMFCVRFQKWHN